MLHSDKFKPYFRGVFMLVFLYIFGLFFSFLLGGICFEKKAKEKQQSKEEQRSKGNIGESLVSKKLKSYLINEQVMGTVINNVTLSVDDGTTQIDHILICTKGVFVIETKHYSGWIYGDAKQKQWLQVVSKKRSKFQNPIHQNYKHIKAIQALFDFVPTDKIKSLVVFTGKGEFKTPRPKDVILLDGIKDWMNQHEDYVITSDKIQFCYGRLELLRLPENEQTDKLHLKNLSKRHAL